MNSQLARHQKKKFIASICASAILLTASPVLFAALLEPPLPYLSFADSPFAPLQSQFSYFHLQTYEGLPGDSSFGSTASAGAVSGPGSLIDSVDGGGNNGHSLFSACGSCGITFTFDANALGHLPTHAGIVWTDGELAIHFTAFDEHGISLGTITDTRGHGFSLGDGDPTNYRFYGVENAAGISAISISNDGGGIEVDHLQYGNLPTPVPAAVWMFGSSLTCIGLLRKKSGLRNGGNAFP